MEHFFNPRNVGEIPEANAVGIAKNPNDGDVAKFFLLIKDDHIVDIKFKTMGCVVAIAASSKLSEILKGLSITEASHISKESLSEEIGGLPEAKIRCSLTCIEALQHALQNHNIEGKNKT